MVNYKKIKVLPPLPLIEGKSTVRVSFGEVELARSCSDDVHKGETQIIISHNSIGTIDVSSNSKENESVALYNVLQNLYDKLILCSQQDERLQDQVCSLFEQFLVSLQHDLKTMLTRSIPVAEVPVKRQEIIINIRAFMNKYEEIISFCAEMSKKPKAVFKIINDYLKRQADYNDMTLGSFMKCVDAIATRIITFIFYGYGLRGLRLFDSIDTEKQQYKKELVNN